MSQKLPDRPNLEHLKNQAKKRLEALRATNPNAQLADALHDVARAYGFESRPKLKDQVDLVAVSGSASPLEGAWIADISRSVRHPANPFRSARMHFAVVGDRIRMKDIFVDADGKQVEGHNVIEADGVPHETPNGYVLTATWRGPRVLETEATQNGAVVGRGRYEVSEDGSMLTITGEEQRIVCRRA